MIVNEYYCGTAGFDIGVVGVGHPRENYFVHDVFEKNGWNLHLITLNLRGVGRH